MSVPVHLHCHLNNLWFANQIEFKPIKINFKIWKILVMLLCVKSFMNWGNI